MIHVRAPERYAEVSDDWRGKLDRRGTGRVAFSRYASGQRLRTMMTQMPGAVGAPIPLACQDWANTKAAYRFLSNDDVSERAILAGHF